MPPVDRNAPKRCDSSDSRMSLMEFMRDWPDDAACLEWLWRERFSEDGTHADCPKCKQRRAFKRYGTAQRRQSWTCTACGHHVHPTAGTIFHKSSTSLHLWFYGFYLMTSTRCGLSAKQLERELGVNYKTAWRMLNKIRNELMADDGEPLAGDVEVDETWHGGKPRARERRERTGRVRNTYRPTVLGMVERGGRIRARVVGGRSTGAILPAMRQNVLPSSMLFTDEYPLYNVAAREYRGHRRIKHEAMVYFDAETGAGTQTVEGFFGLFKSGVRGTYHAVSSRWLQGYLDEFTWRYNHRHDERAQFESLLLRAART